MKQTIAIVVGVLVVVGGVIFGISRVADVSSLDKSATTDSTDSTDSTTTTVPKDVEKARTWDADANAAFGGTDITQNIIDMVDAARHWQDGTTSADDFKTLLSQRHNQFVDIKARLATLRDYPFDKRVKGIYVDSAQLYLETVNVYQAMLPMPAGDMRTQYDLLAKRIRALADRVFDRGHALVQPKLGEKDNPDVDIRLPEEVPNWVAEGLAPGPPLDDPPPPAATDPQLRQATRPEQSRDGWLSAVGALDLPPPSLDNPQATARALVAAVEKLRTTPDPKGDREESARIRLSLLVDADAARAAQAGLPELGRRLLVVADQLWTGLGLPARSSGLDPALLRQS